MKIIQDMIAYKKENNVIAMAALDKLSNHLWYLSEETVAMALFDSNISSATKQKMVENMNSQVSDDEPLKRLKFDYTKPHELDFWQTREIQDFFTGSSKNFFNYLDLECDFLDINPDLWKNSESYEKARKIVSSLRVVNDTAERAVGLVKKFNRVLTNDEEQKQYMYKAVKKHCQKFPKPTKSVLMSG